MAAPRNESPSGEDQKVPDLTPPEAGYELYRHKNTGATETKNWHGLYWARRNAEGDYEIRTVPVSSGEHSAPGGVWPGKGFERYYARVP